MVRFSRLEHRGHVLLGAGCLITGLTGFLVLAHAVHLDVTLGLDKIILTSLHDFSTPFWDVFFQLVTNFGATLTIGAFTAIITLYLIYLRKYRKAVFMVVSVAGAGILATILKLMFERARPDLWQQLVHETTFSFPSGHAVGSSALALSLVVVLWYTRWRRAAIISGIIFVLLIGLSRLYLGVHYPSDILAGWCLSAGWVLLTAGAFYVGRVLYKRR